MRYITIIVLGVLVLTGLFLIVSQKAQKRAASTTIVTPSTTPSITEEVHYHANFLIFTNGTRRDFSDPRYHSLSEEVSIEAEDPTAVHVNAAGITWQDFFNTLPAPFRITKECLYTGTGQTFCNGRNGKLRFFLNGELAQVVLEKKIQDNDQLLVTYGNESETQIQNQLNQIPNGH